MKKRTTMKATLEWKNDFEKYMLIFRTPVVAYKEFDKEHYYEIFDIVQYYVNDVYYGLDTYHEHVFILNSLKGLIAKKELVLAKLTFGIDILDDEAIHSLLNQRLELPFREYES